MFKWVVCGIVSLFGLCVFNICIDNYFALVVASFSYGWMVADIREMLNDH